MWHPLLPLCLVSTLLGVSHAYYYYDQDGEESYSRPIYPRAVKSPPPPRMKSYSPPPPVRARPLPSAPVKGYDTQQRYEQAYEPQQPVPNIDHEVVGQPEPYNFNYAVDDEYGNNQFRKEEQDTSGTVRGSYGYTDSNGLYRIVDYVADHDGFRASIRTNEPAISERNPKTGEVEQPADVSIQAESTPAHIREQSMRYRGQSASGSSSGSIGGASSTGGAYTAQLAQTSEGPSSSYGSQSASTSAAYATGMFSSSTSSFDAKPQRMRQSYGSGAKYRARA